MHQLGDNCPESMLNLFADNAMIHGPTSSTKILPWGGTYNGTEGVKQFFDY